MSRLYLKIGDKVKLINLPYAGLNTNEIGTVISVEDNGIFYIENDPLRERCSPYPNYWQLVSESPSNNLVYYKCRDCLTTFTSSDKPEMCACEGKLKVMGKVLQAKNMYQEVKKKAPCDDRCTHAQGPKCDCPCGSLNHGTGRVIETIVKEGKVVVKSVDDEALNRAYEFRDVKAETEDIKGIFEVVCKASYWTKKDLIYKVNKVYEMTSDKRIAKMIELQEKMKELIAIDENVQIPF